MTDTAPGPLWRSPYARTNRSPEVGVRRFRERLAVARGGAGGRMASMVVIGDSLTEAFTPTKRGYRWPDVVARRLAGSKLGVGHYVPASANTFSSVTAGDWPGGQLPWRYTGTVAGSTAYGSDLHAVTITGASGAVELDYFGDSVNVHYVRTPAAAGAGYSVKIDGAEVATLEANGTVLPAQTLTVGTVGDYGFHTLRIEVPTGTLTFEGVSYSDSIRWGFGIPFDGVRFIGLGHAGFSVPHFTGTDTWAASVVTHAPHCVGIALGANDVALAEGAGGSPAEYRAGLIRMMEMVDAAFTAAGGDRPDFLLIEMPGLPVAWVEAAWDACEDHAPDRASVLDLAGRASFTTGWGPFAANGHPDDGGQQWIADRVVELIDPGCPPQPYRSADDVVVVSALDRPKARLAWTENITIAATAGDGSRVRASDTSGAGTTVRERRHRVWLEPGTYSGLLEVRRNTAPRGTCQVLVAGTSLGTLSTAGTAGSLGAVLGATVTIDTPGWYPVVIRKTADDGDVTFTELRLRRTG